MVETFNETVKGYGAIFNRAQVRPSLAPLAVEIARRILALKSTFMIVTRQTGVPWQWIGAIQYRESDLNLRCCFANGDEIIGTGRKTHNVPAGRGPFSTWEDSAIDEIHRRGLHTIGWRQWSVEMMLFQGEAFNGWGYLGKCNSPYDWSWTTAYGPPESVGGKYDPDHHWNPHDIDRQCGLAAILDELAAIDADTATLLENRSAAPPAGLLDDHVKKANAGKRKLVAGGTAATAAGGVGTVAGGATDTPWYQTTSAIVVAGFGLTIVVIAVVLSIQTGNLLKARW